MIKVTNLQEMNRIENSFLQMHIQKKAEAMMQEYQVENMDDIGCFVILEKEEFTCVPMNELEFVEVLEIGEESYLHGVRIIGDSYGEDIYLPVEVVRC
ncbi:MULTISPECIES: hypothetical protein [Ruminococcus]|uniref:hypothetical protein n=1 Tax=Ruminococcus TaxID=1263 RepID=UPI000E44CC12|nr:MULTISPECIES: hypothetical protein [Ruminococcus]RGM79412.1 hypothetical protein DXB92_08545 [Ruminococcus sp. OM06-36AC]